MTEEIQKLDAMDLRALRQVWLERFGRVPRLRSPELLRLSIAWRLQAARHGGLDAETRRRLRAVGTSRLADPRLRPGTRLVKEWLGRKHEVVVGDKDFAYSARRYRSLSVIAREITGTRWNGPRFFGLRDEREAG
jgi:hypothetical protein